MEQDERCHGCPWCHSEAIGAPVLALFTAAPKWTALHLDGVRVSRAGAYSSNPDGLWIAAAGSWGEGEFYGSIRPDGELRQTRALRAAPWVLDQLATVAAFGAEGIARLGVASGRCCYCGKRLTDEVSIAVGYGPVCARYHGLKHNAAAMAAAL